MIAGDHGPCIIAGGLGDGLLFRSRSRLDDELIGGQLEPLTQVVLLERRGKGHQMFETTLLRPHDVARIEIEQVPGLDTGDQRDALTI